MNSMCACLEALHREVEHHPQKPGLLLTRFLRLLSLSRTVAHKPQLLIPLGSGIVSLCPHFRMAGNTLRQMKAVTAPRKHVCSTSGPPTADTSDSETHILTSSLSTIAYQQPLTTHTPFALRKVSPKAENHTIERSVSSLH